MALRPADAEIVQSDWYARAKPLPLSKVVAVDTMRYPDNRWQPFDLSAAEISTVEGRPDIMGVRIGDGIFFSESYLNQDGVTGYKFRGEVSFFAEDGLYPRGRCHH
jgi:hypothetical protein